MIRLLAAVLFAALCSSAWCVEPGDGAPALALLDTRGELVSLERLKGRVVYVDFWASWCAPCRRSFPWMNDVQQRYAERGLTIIGVNVDKKRSDADRFLQQVPASFAIVFDAAGATPNAWGVKAMPSSYLVDRQGRVAAVEGGFVEERKAQVEARIEALLGPR